jgi:hypothetical protein
MKRTFLVTLALAAMITVSLAFTKDEPKYKNLKILPKNITEKQLDSVMHHFTNSLNVKCNFCHVRNDSAKTWDYAADGNKHKLIARDMMRLTNEINDKYFDFTGGKRDLNAQLSVTCFTCHHGKKQPETVAFRPENSPGQKPDSSRKGQ